MSTRRDQLFPPALQEALDLHAPPPLPDGFADRLLARAATAPARRRRRQWTSRSLVIGAIALTGAAAAAIGVFGDPEKLPLVGPLFEPPAVAPRAAPPQSGPPAATESGAQDSRSEPASTTAEPRAVIAETSPPASGPPAASRERAPPPRSEAGPVPDPGPEPLDRAGESGLRGLPSRRTADGDPERPVAPARPAETLRTDLIGPVLEERPIGAEGDRFRARDDGDRPDERREAGDRLGPTSAPVRMPDRLDRPPRRPMPRRDRTRPRRPPR